MATDPGQQLQQQLTDTRAAFGKVAERADQVAREPVPAQPAPELQPPAQPAAEAK